MAEQLMEKKIIHVADYDITNLSGGQFQRAAICRALINQPDILIGDDPTEALNSSATKEIMKIIDQINKGRTTVIIVTHDIKVASRLERIIFIHDGKIPTEFRLGKYSGTAYRERKLSEWLEKQGF